MDWLGLRQAEVFLGQVAFQLGGACGETNVWHMHEEDIQAPVVLIRFGECVGW
jgi:hypothetical protein